MENNQQHNIDQMFNDAAKVEGKEHFPNFENVWDKIEEKLDQPKKEKRVIPLWIPTSIAAGIALTVGVLFFVNKDEPMQDLASGKTENTTKKTETNLDSLKIKELDQQIQKSIAENPIEKEKEIVAYHDVETTLPKTVEKIQRVEFGNVSIPNPPIPSISINNGDYSISEVYIAPPTPPSVGVKASTVQKTEDIKTVVVLGYNKTSVKPKEVTASTTVSANKLEQRTTTGFLNSLQGEAPGLAINSTSGQPGSAKLDIVIRGMRTLNASSDPLYVINGELTSFEGLKQIDPNKIKKVTVLKDASATAIYGSRGQNGVVVINTKRLTRAEKKKIKELANRPQKEIIQAQIQQNEESYDNWQENPFEISKNQPLSTFSIDVDNAAYSNVRRMINNGQIVDKNAVRVEEMINYFKYNYPQPTNNQPFSINTEYSESPWNKNHQLLKIGLQGKEIPKNQLPASNFVFLIDVSGSMNDTNKLPLLKSSFKVLLDKLRSDDKVALVTYAGSAGVVLEPTSAQFKEKILTALDNLSAGGSTAGGQGIELAYKLAQENFVKNGNNRVILATDGDFNVGVSDNNALQTMIEEKRKSGIFLTCLGFGMGNYKDNRLEMLADKGNGNYAYIDNLQEANKFLGREFVGSMYAIAKDVKIQIEFNPKLVASYRLIGYENRKLRNEDFTNDKIDAGELGVGHTVTALYEIIPVNVKSEFLSKDASQLKYSQSNANDSYQNELATVKFRYKEPDGEVSKEITKVVNNTSSTISASSEDFKFVSAVAWLGLTLRQSQYIENKNYDQIIDLAKKGKGKDDEGYRAEFIRLVETYQNLIKN